MQPYSERAKAKRTPPQSAIEFIRGHDPRPRWSHIFRRDSFEVPNRSIWRPIIAARASAGIPLSRLVDRGAFRVERNDLRAGGKVEFAGKGGDRPLDIVNLALFGLECLQLFCMPGQ